jgi:hypothetical protein
MFPTDIQLEVLWQENQEYDLFGYTEHVAPGLAPYQAPFSHPFRYRVPIMLGTDNIRRFASRYSHH